MVSGPEISKADFEEQTILRERNAAYNFRHHEETPSSQKRIFTHVRTLSEHIQKMGNPFSVNY